MALSQREKETAKRKPHSLARRQVIDEAFRALCVVWCVENGHLVDGGERMNELLESILLAVETLGTD